MYYTYVSVIWSVYTVHSFDAFVRASIKYIMYIELIKNFIVTICETILLSSRFN